MTFRINTDSVVERKVELSEETGLRSSGDSGIDTLVLIY